MTRKGKLTEIFKQLSISAVYAKRNMGKYNIRI